MSTDRALEAARRLDDHELIKLGTMAAGNKITGCIIDEEIESVVAELMEARLRLPALSEEVERMRDALERIRDHWASNYDHQFADTEAYRGSYGIGIVDGHRACASIARTALTPPSSQPGNSEVTR